MSSKARREELRKQYEAEEVVRRQEEYRLAHRTMWEKIEEANDFKAVREILHDFAEKLGLEP